jgi:hypothetical protein
MPNRELASEIKQENAFNIQTINSDTTTNGNIIDLQGFDSCTFLLQIGTLTDGDYVPLIQEGDEADLSDATAVADTDLTGTEASAGFTEDTDDRKVSKIGYTGGKRYVRFNIVSTNTTSGANMGAQVIKGHPSHAPVA